MRRNSNAQPGPLTSRAIRWAGAGAMLAGALFLLWGYVDVNNTPPYRRAIADALSFLVPALFLVSLLGLYGRCQRRLGMLGNVGVALGCYGSVLGVVKSFADFSFWYAFVGGKGPLLYLVADWFFWLLVGLTLIGIAALRAKDLRAWGILALIIGLCGWVYFVTDSGLMLERRSVHVPCGLLFGLGWVVWGHALRRRWIW